MSWDKQQTSPAIGPQNHLHLPLVLRTTSIHNQLVLLGKVICSALLGEEHYPWGQAYQDAYQDAAKNLIACELDIFSKIVQH